MLKSIGQTPLSANPATDSFGCRFNQLYTDQTLTGGHMKFFRKGTRDTQLEQVRTAPSDRGFVVGISLLGGHRRRIFHKHHATTHDFEDNAFYTRDLSEDYKADLGGPFDFLLLEISPAALDRIAGDAELSGVTSLSPHTGTKDIVLTNLARAMIPAFERPEEASALFLDQMATAIGTYIVHRYGGRDARAPIGARKLSRTHEHLAKAILLEHLDGEISIETVAQACNLSRGWFIRAFRETTGHTPYQWLLNERIRRARELLRTSNLSLAEVALSCGFADQSHFTRVFTNIVGATPGNWRREF